MLVGPAVRRVAIVGGLRIPFARAYTAYASATNQDLLTAVLRAVVERFKLQGERLGDVAAGAVIKHTKDYNLVRESVLSSGLDPQTPGLDLQRACGTGLEAALDIGNKIALGQIEAGIAGGVDSISDAPDRLSAFLSAAAAAQLPRPQSLAARGALARPATEGFPPRHARGRRAAHGPVDGTEHRDHGQALADQPYRAGSARLRQPSEGRRGLARRVSTTTSSSSTWVSRATTTCARIRSLDKLGKLSPSFVADGTLTAGNSTPLTDGASAVLLATPEWAAKRNLPVLAYLRYGKVWAVDFASGKEGLLMAPAYAVPAMLRDAGITLQDFDYYEIHEAFAAQVLCTLKAWESADYCRHALGLPAPLGGIDRGKLNIKGGSVALGHPFAATGTRIVATLAKLLAADANAKRGLVSVCTAGGMGVTAIVER